MPLSYITLKDRAVLKLSGPDTERYLNGQITQNVTQATTSVALQTCVTNAKGKLQAIGFIRKHEDGILLDIPLELRETMLQRIDMYIIADDVALEDLTDSITFHHVFSESTPDRCWSVNRYGMPGYDTLEKPDSEELDHLAIESIRIKNAIPAWGTELNENTLPPEALLETSAISYNKGCYIGQEVISRIKAAGKVNKKLTKFSLNKAIKIPFSIPNPESPEGKPAGVITSITKDQDFFIALGYLNRKFFGVKQFIAEDVTLNTID